MKTREIKFRAFHKLKKVMEYFDKPYNPDWDYWDGCKGTRLSMLNGILSNNSDKIEWLQYTGLKDKNGKEIYEGDIVKWTVNDVDRISEVIFDSGCFWMNKVWNDWLRGEYEIIGNIYENQELL